MSKRPLSPPPLPPAKRPELGPGGHSQISPLPLQNSLYDELILCIFSHLSWADLCAAQATNRNWSRLARDNALWRNLYIGSFGRPRLRGGGGTFGCTDGRELKPLPSRAKGREARDWKWMFRISSNWRKGRCAVESWLAPPLEAPQAPHHILLVGSLIISASSRPSSSPSIHLLGLTNLIHNLYYPTSHPGLYHITALARDQSISNANHTRVATFLHNGEFCIFHVEHSDPTLSRVQMAYSPARRFTNITRVVYHHPILIALSESFSLSIYDLSSGSVRHSQTLTSYTSYPPTSLVLSAPSPEIYKLLLTYSVPVYPRHWSVGVTELIIAGPSPVPTSSFSSFLHRSSTPMTVISTRTIRAVDVPQGWMDENKLRHMQEQWSRKVSRVADTQTDGKWVILAPADPAISAATLSPVSSPASPISRHLYLPTSLQLYRLSLPSPSTTVSAPRPKFTFVRDLHGHTTPVSSVAVADGRCVSLGMDGSVWIWDLEIGASTEASGLNSETERISDDAHIAYGTVIFDERRIVTARGSHITIRRFDV
ncbi:hypothetical protein AX15_006790 [Amanita polypyramis BW_CC]|nr:hypothetical protein AX15_006790 [Amanita polypyramis BW_CC]